MSTSPGLGLSGGKGVDDWEQWLPDLLGDGPVDLIGHSIGAAAAVTAADQQRTKVASLTLIAPFFLQRPAGVAARQRALAHAYLRRTNPNALSRKLTGSDASAAALESSVSDLKRTTAGAAASHLALAASKRWRDELRAALDRFDGPVRIITGTDDPLTPDAEEQMRLAPNVELVAVSGAGHHPQLTHLCELLELITATHA